MLSSTWPGNHHRVKAAGDSAGQPVNRVFGRHRILLDGLAEALSDTLDLVTFPHIASHRGIVQPAQAAGRLCQNAGVPLVLDVCQSLGHVDVSGIGPHYPC